MGMTFAQFPAKAIPAFILTHCSQNIYSFCLLSLNAFVIKITALQQFNYL